MPTQLKSMLALMLLICAMTTKVSSQIYKLPAKCNNNYKQTDYIGTLISDVINMHGVEHCASMCAGFYGCTCYSYNTVGRICYLRSGCNLPAVNAIFSSGECVNARPSSQYSLPSTCNNKYPRTDYIGTLIARVINMYSTEQCAYICSTFHGCTCYSYDTVGRICYLRYGCNIPAPNAIFSGGDCVFSQPSQVVTKKPLPALTPRPVPPQAGVYVGCCNDFVAGSWQEARQACQRHGDELATILDGSQNAAALNMCRGSQGCWIGLKTDGSGSLAWSSGEPVTYNRFAPGELSSQPNACVFMTAQGEWKMASCTKALPTVCQVPLGFAAVLDQTKVGSHANGWLVASICASVCCLMVIAACVVVGRRKQGELQPLLSQTVQGSPTV